MRRWLGVLSVVLLVGVSVSGQQPKPFGVVRLDNSAPHVGDVAIFTATVGYIPYTGPNGYVPYLYVECDQAGIEVFDPYLIPSRVISGTINDGVIQFQTTLVWAGGEAECEASLFYAKVGRNYDYREPSIRQANTLDVVTFVVQS